MKLAGLKSIENAHDESVWAVTWVPATETRPPLLLTGSLDETVRLWKSDDLVLERTNTGHCLGVASVAAHPLGRIAASSSLDSFVRVFDVDSNATVATLEAPPSEVWQMKFDPKCSSLVSLPWTADVAIIRALCCQVKDLWLCLIFLGSHSVLIDDLVEQRSGKRAKRKKLRGEEDNREMRGSDIFFFF